MNEVQLIRNQLALERQHVTAVANACAAALQNVTDPQPAHGTLGHFRRACVDYLACVLAWFEERDQRLADLLQARFSPGEPARRAFEEVLARPGRSRETLARLESACVAPAASGFAGRRQDWQEFAEYFNSAWSTRRDALDALLAPNTRARDWRMLVGIDADSILEERRRYAQVSLHVPPGVTLGAAADRS